jgi:Cation efflux family
LDSSLPHDLIQEYEHQQSNSHATRPPDVPPTISEELVSAGASSTALSTQSDLTRNGSSPQVPKVDRTPRNLFKIPDKKVDENTPLLSEQDESVPCGPNGEPMPQWEPEDDTNIRDKAVKVAIYINIVANAILLVLKIIVTALTSSVSVLAALVDAVLDFLSTAIVWTTTKMISTRDDYQYPIGRSRLEPIGVLVFSVIMITSFFQVGIEGFSRLSDSDHAVIQLGVPAVAIMVTTVIVKGLCWLWCRLIKNSSVQALAQDAATDVVFNTFSIIFPLGTVPCFHSVQASDSNNSWILREHLVP